MASPPAAESIGQYLIRRLREYGVRDVFGIPGDYVLAFYDMMEKSPLRLIGCTREDCAGFAADAYARVNGIGAVCVTYCVGGLSLCNSIAGAYAEKSPVVVISGSPGLGERINNPLLHHKVKDFHTQAEVFRRLCGADAQLNDPNVAFRRIDRVLDHVWRYKRPGYIELPRDLINVVPDAPQATSVLPMGSDPGSLAEAVAEAAERIAAAKKPVIIAGVEIHRFGLQEKLLAFAEGAGIPIASTLLGKSVVSERHPLFVGLYEGAMGREEVTQFVEESDCVILLGAFMTDINLGIYTANLDPARCIYATSEKLRISRHHYEGVLLADFLDGLIKAGIKAPERTLPPKPGTSDDEYRLDADAPMTIRRMIARLNQSMDASIVRDGRHWRRPVRLQRPGDPAADRVPRAGLLHVDGLRGAGGPRRDGGAARVAADCAGGRRRLPDDRHGALHDRPPQLRADHHRAGQRRLRHGAPASQRQTRFQ